MSKELKALERVRNFMSNNAVHWKQDIAIIETALKRLEELEKAFVTLSKEDEKTKKLLSLEIEKNRTLEIIKKKRVDADLFLTILEDKNQDDKLWSYNFWNAEKNSLTQEEYELLKEMLK